MRPILRSLLVLLPFLPLTAAATGAGEPRAGEKAQPVEQQGQFLAKLTQASPEAAAVMVAGMADINAATSDEHITALHAAVAYNRLDIMLMLLKRGANTESMMKPGLTPLSAAAMKNDTDAISMLLAHGAKLDFQTRGGVSALKLACAKGNVDATQVLLAHGADPRPADAEGHTALSLAQEHAGENKLTLMRMLLEHGASPEAQVGEEGWSPLMRAVVSQDIGAADLLLSYGARADAGENSDSTPLMMAAGYGYAGLVQRLLDCGASATRQDADGNDALDHAALGARFTHALAAAALGSEAGGQQAHLVDMAATCRLLLERGASVHHVDGTGSTPLHIAARTCAAENVRLLLEAGADVRARNREGHNALISALLPTPEKIRLTFSPGQQTEQAAIAPYISPLFDERSQLVPTLHLLLEAGADPTEADASGRSALDYAAGNPALQELLQRYLPRARAAR